MARNRKDRSELEYLRGKLKGLTRENRILKRRLRQLEKSKHMYEELGLSEDVLEEIYEAPPVMRADCTDCGKGSMKLLIELPNKDIFECDVCQHRTTRNK